MKEGVKEVNALWGRTIMKSKDNDGSLSAAVQEVASGNLASEKKFIWVPLLACRGCLLQPRC